MKDKLKLHPDEVVYCGSFELHCKCCELAHKLGLVTAVGYTYLDELNWEEYETNCFYDFHSGAVVERKLIGSSIIITATEWLNRHGIFVYGQEVLCTDLVDVPRADYKNRIYLAPHVAVAGKHSDNFKQKKPFNTITWKYTFSPFPEWK